MAQDAFHPLNVPVEFELPERLKRLGSANISETPCNAVSREDVPPAPVLPDDHPLNGVVWTDLGYPIKFFKRRTVAGSGGAQVQLYTFNHDGNECLPGQPVVVNGVVRGTVLEATRVVDDTGVPCNRVLFSIQAPGGGTIGAMYRAHPDVNPGLELVIEEPVVALPSDRRVYIYGIRQVNALDCALAHVVVQAHADNGNMVFGLFFVPSSRNLPPDWRRRAAGWAAWNWGRHGACIRIPTPRDTRLRSYPEAYIPTLLNGILNGLQQIVADWKIDECPKLPPWLPDKFVYKVEPEPAGPAKPS